MSNQLIIDAPKEYEWKYLVNETFEGEKCIVPLLVKIYKQLPTGEFRDALYGQLEEERDHVSMYFDLVGKENLTGSGFATRLYNYVEGLDSITLKLFALQGMLEGVALGALDHRIQNWSDYGSYKTDKIAFKDEISHVTLSYKHFKTLKNWEGEVKKSDLQKVSKEVNEIFSTSFNGEVINRVFKQNYSIDIDADKINSNSLMKSFRIKSAKSVIQSKSSFITKYVSA